MPLLGAAAWLGGLAAQLLPGAGLRAATGSVAGLALAGGLAWARGRVARRTALTAAGVLLVAVAAACVGLVRQAQLARGPVAELAGDGAMVEVRGTVTSDPRQIRGRFGDQVLVRMEAHALTGRGASYLLAAPVLVIADPSWRRVPLGATVRASGRLSPADGSDLAAVLGARGPPDLVAGPDVWWRGADAVRRSLRESVEARPADQRALVPALVDGDDAAVDPALADDFRTTGLTHLLAVSGTNLTLVVGFLMVLARWGGVRGRWLYVVGACGIAGFVLLARTEPSVLRAAVMGAVGLVAMGANGRQRGSRALGVAVVVLLLVDPPLATSMGFALSVLATAGILLLAPGWRDALCRWLPRWLGEAVAVPAAAQLACTPLVAAISGQVSLVAVAANLVVAPAVGPATVLGLGRGTARAGRAVGGPDRRHPRRVVRGLDRARRPARSRAAGRGRRLGDRGGAPGGADAAQHRHRGGRAAPPAAAHDRSRLQPAARAGRPGPAADPRLAARRLAHGGLRRRAGRRAGAARRPRCRGGRRHRARAGRGRRLPGPAGADLGAARRPDALPRGPRRRARRGRRRPPGRRDRDDTPGRPARRCGGRGRRGPADRAGARPGAVRRAPHRRRPDAPGALADGGRSDGRAGGRQHRQQRERRPARGGPGRPPAALLGTSSRRDRRPWRGRSPG